MSKKSSTHFLTLNNRKYNYTLKTKGKTTHVLCEAANIDQDFLNEDIPALLIDLPNLILAEKAYEKKQNKVIRFRVTAADKKAIEQKAAKKGYRTVSNFLRDLALR